jgi:hypothetical protein
LGDVNLFKALGLLPASEPAIGRLQELATDGWCRQSAELPGLVELEKAACPHKYGKDRFFERLLCLADCYRVVCTV